MASAVELLLLAAAGPLLREGASGTWDLGWTQADFGTWTNANSGTQAITASWSITAGDAAIGTVYEVEVPYFGTFENQTLGFRPYLNGSAVTTSGGDTIGAAFFTAATVFAGTVRVKVQVTAIGASGTAKMFVDGGIGITGNRSAGANNNNAYLSSQNTGVSFNTTVANTIAVAAVWGGSTAGQTITGSGSTYTRKGP